MPASAVIPVLGYPDVSEAIDWLCGAFGFSERWRAGNHRAQLAVGDGAIALTEHHGEHSRAEVMVRIADAEAHHERARQFGAQIVRPPSNYPYGERQYTAEDPAGHRWTFSESIADVAPEEWGGSSAG